MTTVVGMTWRFFAKDNAALVALAWRGLRDLVDASHDLQIRTRAAGG